MPTPTYDLIASNVLSSSAASVSFSSIPATYRDLIVVINGKTSTGSSCQLRLNSDTGSNYSRVRMAGNGSATDSFSGTSTSLNLSDYVSFYSTTENSLIVVQIMDYSATDKHKSMLTRTNKAGTGVQAQAARWADTSAVSTVTLLEPNFTFDSGSTFYLYGIVS